MIQCVILAGGLGTRIRHVDPSRPKALIEVRGLPFIEYQLRWLESHGAATLVLAIGYKGDLIRGYLESRPSNAFEVSFVDEGDELRGTGGALRLASDQGVLRTRFAVLYGDSYLRVDLGAVAERCYEMGSRALLTVLKNEDRWVQSNADVNAGKVVAYGKGAARASRFEYVDYGLSILSRDLIERDVAPKQWCDLSNLFTEWAGDGILDAYLVEHRFFEVGSPQGIADLEAYILEHPE